MFSFPGSFFYFSLENRNNFGREMINIHYMRHTFVVFSMAVLLSIACQASPSIHDSQKRITHIVHMDKSAMPAANFNSDDHLQWYHASLKSASSVANMLYAYDEVIHGFSAQMTTKEAESLAQQPGVLDVQPEVMYQFHTTRTPQFLGLTDHHNTPPLSHPSVDASEVIIGVIDTGVWPEVPSFNDDHLPPVPKRWKGKCEVSKDFKASSCNRKLIGARAFCKGYFARVKTNTTQIPSPRDTMGHGTHTASIAAGSPVTNASFLGDFARGTARGMAPRARVAVYKICSGTASDILAAMDMALADGVDIMSISLGLPLPFAEDPIAIGAFRAMEKGVSVSCSAGNAGPEASSTLNVAPWITTVGAGTLDRAFPAKVTLGDKMTFFGESLYNGKPLSRLVPLVYAGNSSKSYVKGRKCSSGSLIRRRVEGKIVACEFGLNPAEQGIAVGKAGGVGMILLNNETDFYKLVADATLLPFANMDYKSSIYIKKYISSTARPVAKIGSAKTVLHVKPSPAVAEFSSRGPNELVPNILKPDIIAPGVNILAGWTGAVGPSRVDEDTRRVSFNILSGTSMACPHGSGIAALLKAAHQEWSPAAIRSALITTASTTYSHNAGGHGEKKPIIDLATGKPATGFAMGAGQVNPNKALNPGLIYDLGIDDYINYLCAMKYNTTTIKIVAKRKVKCSLRIPKKYSVGDLNYPSFTVALQGMNSSEKRRGHGAFFILKHTRTVTNVGKAATYRAFVSSPPAVKILIMPTKLSFSKLKEGKRFTMTFNASSMPSGTIQSARLEWRDGEHIVGSPIVVYWT